MRKGLLLRTTLLSGALLAASGLSANGQFVYPGGYGGYGWGGWGGETVLGSQARGMGAFAAGVGQYNVQTAQARAINANTAMRFNEYLWESQQIANRRHYQRLAERNQKGIESRAAVFNRLSNNPSPSDINNGNALNVILDQVTDPRVYVQSVSAAQKPVSSKLVKDIPFRYASQAITVSLNELSRQGVPEALKTNAALAPERMAMGKIADEARAQLDETGKIDPDTLHKAQAAARALRDKVVQVMPAGTRERREVENWCKALYGLTRMMEEPDIKQFLSDLDKVDETSLSSVIGFMQSFNLRFGAAETPRQRAVYAELYPMMLEVRKQAGVPTNAPMPSEDLAIEADDHRKPSEFFSGMEFEDIDRKPRAGATPAPAPAPAPAPPPQP